MQFISHKDSTVYSGDKADYRDIEVTSERPSQYHNPVIENREHVGWEIDLPAAKEAKINELRSACRAHIFAGFDSDALGTAHHYPAKQDGTYQDQLNLNGLVTKSYEEPTGTFKFWCADSNGAWVRRGHTAEQIRQAGVDGANHVIDAQEKLALLIDDAEAATTETELDAITW